MRRAFPASALIIGALIVAPASARACGPYGGCGSEFVLTILGIGVGTAAVGLADLAVLGTDLHHASRAEWLPEDLAWVNLAYGSARLVAGALMSGLAPDDDAWLGIGGYSMAAGLLMVLDGALSLGLHVERERPRLGLALAPSPHGAGLQVRGSF